jgi:hypothetical protein
MSLSPRYSGARWHALPIEGKHDSGEAVGGDRRAQQFDDGELFVIQRLSGLERN